MGIYGRSQRSFFEPPQCREIEDADGVGEVGSMACGDALRLMLKVDENQRIADVKFQTFGCASAIASSSALTELVKGMTLEEAEKITNDNIAEYLGGLPKEKIHCSVMGQDALKQAILNYRGVREAPAAEGDVVCECFGVTDKQIEDVVKAHDLKTIEDVTDYIKAGGGCGNCHENIQAIIDTVHKREAQPAAAGKKLTNVEKIKRIEETLEREVKPALKKDGGSIELIDVEGDTVYVKLIGTCMNCATSDVTLKHFVEAKLQEFVTPELVVKEVKQ